MSNRAGASYNSVFSLDLWVTVMSNARYFDTASAEQGALRSAVNDVDERLAHLSGSSELNTAWAALVKLLALPKPQRVRDCPSCGAVSMHDATRCGRCWVRLTPVP